MSEFSLKKDRPVPWRQAIDDLMANSEPQNCVQWIMVLESSGDIITEVAESMLQSERRK